MAAAIAWGSGTTFTVPGNFLNNSTALLWIWYSGGGGNHGGLPGVVAGYGGNGGNIYLIDPINLAIGGQYGVGVGGNAGPGAGVNASSFYVWPQQGYNGVNPGGAGGGNGAVLAGGGGGSANPGGGGGNGGTAQTNAPGGGAGAGSAPWPSYGGAGGTGSDQNNNFGGDNGTSYGGGGGGGAETNSFQSAGGIGIQGVVYLWYNTVSVATISSCSPTSTTYQNDGVPFYLFGSMFNTVNTVQIQDIYTGGLYNCGINIISDSEMLIYPPAVPQHPAYNPNIYIYNQAGEAGFSNIYTLYPNIPQCYSVTGNSYDNGTNQVDLNGVFFTTLSLVQIDGVGVMNYTTTPTGTTPGQWWFGNDSIIGMNLPAIAAQEAVAVTLRVGNSSGQAVIGMVYIPSPPTFSGISTSTGDESGGYSVTITGSGFATTESVYFGSAICPSFTINSDTSITVVVPQFDGNSTFNGGQVNITLYNPTASVSGFDFTYTFSGYPALNAAHSFV